MKKDAAFVKMWITVGPFKEAEDASSDNPFRPEKVLRLAATWQASAGKIGWQAAMVNPADNHLDLAALYQNDHSVVYSACFPVLRAEEAAVVRLSVSAPDRVEVWLNNASIGSLSESAGQKDKEAAVDLKLQPGENLLFLKVIKKGNRRGLSARLTDPDGGYLKDVGYADPVARLSAAGVKIDAERWLPGK